MLRNIKITNKNVTSNFLINYTGQTGVSNPKVQLIYELYDRTQLYNWRCTVNDHHETSVCQWVTQRSLLVSQRCSSETVLRLKFPACTLVHIGCWFRGSSLRRCWHSPRRSQSFRP